MNLESAIQISYDDKALSKTIANSQYKCFDPNHEFDDKEDDDYVEVEWFEAMLLLSLLMVSYEPRKQCVAIT